MSRRARCEVNADIEAVAGDEPARGGDEHGEQRVSRGRRRKQHAQRVALIEAGEPGDTLAAGKTDFGRAVRQ